MLNTIKNYLKEIIYGIKERIRNPFTERNSTPFAGALFIALVLYNWQLVFSLFSFDYNETRLTKIEIISSYLKSESWKTRISFPILIAFGSIVFFYIFNNISLGLTIFFNRWFKGTVLFLTDRSKIITREEFEKVNSRASDGKKNYDRLKSKLLASEDERATLDKQLTDLTGKYDQVIAENERIKEQATTTTTTTKDPKNQFRIIWARYGTEEAYDDVTEIVSKLISSSSRFTVDNKVLESDPLVYSVKSLFIIYEHYNETFRVTANEEEIVELKEGKLRTIQTEKSKRKQAYLKNEEKIGEIFNGFWILTITSKDGVTDSEPLMIDNVARYFVHSKLRFYLKTIDIDESNKKITFNKIDLQRKLYVKETLTIQDNGLITGTDSKGNRLEYRQQK